MQPFVTDPSIYDRKKKEGGNPTEAALKREKIYNLIYLKNQCEYRSRR